jgi:hypothetical protein
MPGVSRRCPRIARSIAGGVRTNARQGAISAKQMDPRKAQEHAAELMLAFARRTGLVGDAAPRRYLWTDAFAVCNCIALAQAGDRNGSFAPLAAAVVEQVHRVLGRHRADDAREGWISGLGDAEGAAHPTAGGLRIGKPLPERSAHARLDPELEWDRDGQYFHYLTRWMHALDQFAHAFDRADAGRWAGELAQAAARGFVQRAADGAPLRMAWKMSIDLSRPLVPSMGQHDPLDGLVSCLQLQARGAGDGDQPRLEALVRDFALLARDRDWRSDDPLGLGGLLGDACRLAQLPGDDVVPGDGARPALLLQLLEAAQAGLAAYLRQRPLQQPVARRLAFRELGLGIGLQAIARVQAATAATVTPAAAAVLARLADHVPLARAITDTWLVPDHQQAHAWRAHEDINTVMLATCLQPSGYLDLQ